MEILFLFLGIVLGGVGVWLPLKYSYANNNLDYINQINALELKNSDLKDSNQKYNHELEQKRKEIIELNSAISTSNANLENLKTRYDGFKDEIKELHEKNISQFKNLASDILEEKSKKFTDQNKYNISELLNPLKEKITDFEKKIEYNSKENLQQSAALREQLKGLRDTNLKMSKEAENLTKALKGDTKTQGNWGEFILESILEKSGLQQGREYILQQSHTNDEGKRYQPDVIINLPKDRYIIIDSKVSLIAYEKYVNEPEQNMEVNLKHHQLSIRNHIKNLSEKNYQNIFGVKSPDFTLMFLPIESAFSLAVQNDLELFNHAYKKNIVLVCPSTLIATLRMISNIWNNEKQNQHAYSIAEKAGSLYDKFVAFSDDLIKIGNQLNSTQNSYKNAMNKLCEGKGNLVNRTNELKELGALTTKMIDNRLIDKSNDN